MTRFDEIQVGDRAEISHAISEQDIERFVALTGDDNKIHTDRDFAGRTSFKKPVAHGMLSASFISTIIGTKIPGDGALWFSQTLDFLLPVRVGDTITIVAEVVAKHERLNVIELQTDIFNQDKQKVIAGKSKVKIVEDLIPNQSSINDPSPVKKVALVVGATGGIGSEAVMQLAELGYDIALHYHHNRDLADRLLEAVQAKNQKAFLVQADLMDSQSVTELVEKVQRRLGQITFFVNCATLSLPRLSFEDISWADIASQIDINIKANFCLAKAIVPSMKQSKFGKLVFITSQMAEGTPPADRLPYVIAKQALHGFGKALAVELAPYNVCVNFVSPGMTDTDLVADIPEKAKLLVAARTPMKRLARPIDIAKVIAFLAYDCDYITGETIRVNGGAVMI